MFGEAQLADHLRLEQAHGVARGRVAKARRELLGDGGAADDAATLENPHPQARLGEVTGTDEAVVTGADDERIEIGGGGLATG